MAVLQQAVLQQAVLQGLGQTLTQHAECAPSLSVQPELWQLASQLQPLTMMKKMKGWFQSQQEHRRLLPSWPAAGCADLQEADADLLLNLWDLTATNKYRMIKQKLHALIQYLQYVFMLNTTLRGTQPADSRGLTKFETITARQAMGCAGVMSRADYACNENNSRKEYNAKYGTILLMTNISHKPYPSLPQHTDY